MKKDKVMKQCSKENSQAIEKDYINNMLDIPCSEIVSDHSVKHVVTADFVSHKRLYEGRNIECRIFRIAGLNLALPLLSICKTMGQQKILSVNKKIKKSGMCIGGINHENKFIKIADLTFLIMKGEDNTAHASKYEGKRVDVLFINECAAGIIYDEVIQTQIISYEDVCWRDSSSDRTWLAGTVKQYGFSLLDAQGIIDLLNVEC